MQTAPADWTEFAPPQPPGQRRALALAIVAHLLLLGALTWGVTWKHQSDSALSVEAELWSAVPQEAAPKPTAPPAVPPPPRPVPKPAAPPHPAPPPPDLAQRNADIALARQKKEAQALAERQKLELEQKKRQQLLKLEEEKKAAQKLALEQKRLLQEQLEREKQKKAADEKKAQDKKLALEAQRKEAALKEAAKKKEDDARAEAELKAQREANLARMRGLAGATGSRTAAGQAVQSAGPTVGYAGKVAARILPNIVFTNEITGNPKAEVEVRAAPDGTILSRKLTQSSGSKAWDEAVLKAIDKTIKLPIDTDGRVPPAMIMEFRPKDLTR